MMFSMSKQKCPFSKPEGGGAKKLLDKPRSPVHHPMQQSTIRSSKALAITSQANHIPQLLANNSVIDY